MHTTIRKLTPANVQALIDTLPAEVVETTATTATFLHQTPEQAAQLVSELIVRLPGRRHPKASLHAVLRKLEVRAKLAAQDDPRLLTPKPSPAEVLDRLGELLADPHFQNDVGPKLTCKEAVVIHDVLDVVLGLPVAAEGWINEHAYGDDDPEDEHHEVYLSLRSEGRV